MNTPLPPPPPPPPDAPTGSVSATRSWYRKKRFVIPLAILAIAVVAAVVVEPESDDDPPAAGASTPTPDGQRPDPTEASAVAVPDGSREAPLPLGTTAEVGDYDVAVVSFVGDATAEVRETNVFNEAPGDGEVYSLVRLQVTYRGDRQGFPAMDLSVGYIGDDGRIYVDHDCGAVRPDSMMDQPQLVAGGTAEGTFCLRMPAAVLGTGAIFVEPLISFRDTKTWWAER